MNSSLYIHIPFCRQKCDYCDFFSIAEKDRKGKQNDVSDGYISAVLNEARFYAELYEIERWRSIYLGGGTPGILSGNQLFDLISGVFKIALNPEKCEITVEVNPENVSEEKIRILEKAGANRISMGIQALDDKALRAVNRKSDVKTVLNALSLLGKFWNGRLSVDFIAGLPGQTYKSFESQFKILDDFKKIDHVSLYTLTVEENTPLWKKIEDGKVRFSQDKADKMWIFGRNILEKKGFFQYEISNFARPGFESVHNSSYWKQKNYIGAGSGAVGTVYDFDSKTALRWTNTLSVAAYVDFWEKFEKSRIFGSKDFELSFGLKDGKKQSFNSDKFGLKDNEKPESPESFSNEFQKIRKTENLDEETLEFEFLMTGFRMTKGVSSKDFFERFGKHLEERIGAENGVFARWKKKRLACAEKRGDDAIYFLNRRGILFLNQFLEELI